MIDRLIYNLLFQTAKYVEIYNEDSEKWSEPKSLAINKINFSVAFIEDRLLIIGGTKFSGKNAEPLNMVRYFTR